MTAHSHVRLQFRCLGNRWVLTLKPHQKQTYLSLSRSLVHRQTWRLTGLFHLFWTWDAWEYRFVRWTRWSWSRWSGKNTLWKQFPMKKWCGSHPRQGTFPKILSLRVGRMWMEASTVTCVSEENFCLLLAINILIVDTLAGQIRLLHITRVTLPSFWRRPAWSLWKGMISLQKSASFAQ